MSGTEKTFHITREGLRKPESKTSGQHGGIVPKDSDVSLMKSIVDTRTNRDEDIDRRKANLPLPEQPYGGGASSLVSANMRTTAVGSGRVDAAAGASEEADALRGPATAESSVRVDGKELKKQTAPTGNLGRQGKDGLDELPKDALAREARGSV